MFATLWEIKRAYAELLQTREYVVKPHKGFGCYEAVAFLVCMRQALPDCYQKRLKYGVISSYLFECCRLSLSLHSLRQAPETLSCLASSTADVIHKYDYSWFGSAA